MLGIKLFAAMILIFFAVNSCKTQPASSSKILSEADDHPRFGSNEEAFTYFLRNDQGLRDGLSPEELEHLQSASYLPKVLKRYAAQPESAKGFAKYVADYLRSDRIQTGKEIFAGRHQASRYLKFLEEQYSVDRQIIIALWGAETDYGAAIANESNLVPMIDALATLSCHGIRQESNFFTRQLRIAAQLINEGSLELDVKSSWAGAIGHFQFMPETYQKHALGYDAPASKGPADMDHPEDGFRSAVNYLKKLGWDYRLPWGMEANLSEQFRFNHLTFGFRKKSPEDPNQRVLKTWKELDTRTISEWRRLGVYPEFSGFENRKAALYLPMGIHGPKYLVFKNFLALFHWNHSTKYVIAAGLLSDLISGRRTDYVVKASRSKDIIFTRREMMAIQIALGFPEDEVDGYYGQDTATAIYQMQKRRKLSVKDGYPTRVLFPNLNTNQAIISKKMRFSRVKNPNAICSLPQ